MSVQADVSAVTVPVSSAWSSKVNWTQAVAAFAMILTLVSGGKIGMSADQQTAAVVTIGVLCNIATWILKTFFTSTVHAASLPKVVMFIVGIILCSLMLGLPAAMAANSGLPVKKAPSQGGLSISLPCIGSSNIPLGCTPIGGGSAPTKVSTETVDPLTFLRQFGYKDLNNALLDANGQTPPNKTTAQCWTYLLTLVPEPAAAAPAASGDAPAATPAATNPATSLLPAVPGIASIIQKALDDQQILVTWLSPGGGLEQLNLACAPAVNMVNARLLTGGAVGAAAAAALSNPATAPLIAGLQAMFAGIIALPKVF
jgi:hypothetical protein